MPPSSGQSSHAPLASLAAHWHACRGDIPPPLVGASVTLVDDPDPAKARLYLFGGRLVTTRRMVNDMYELNLLTLRWTHMSGGSDDDSDTSPAAAGPSRIPSEAPQPRYFHSCNLWDGKLIIFGGMGYVDGNEAELCVLDEVAAFDLATQTWDFDFVKQASSSSSLHYDESEPQPRYAHLSSTTADLLVIIGGQDMANRYVEEINVLDLKQRKWTVKQPYDKQRGSYRSLAVEPIWQVVDEDQGAASPDADQAVDAASVGAAFSSHPLLSSSNISMLPLSSRDWDKSGNPKPLPVYVYTNYSFTDVKREMEVVLVDASGSSEKGVDGQSEGGCHIHIEDQSHVMTGVSLPPGLRFPMGAILGQHLLISGTYLANTSQTFAIWALHLRTMTWSRLDVGPLLSTGSWNRGVLWPLQSRLIVFGHRERDLVADYNHRQTNWDHVLTIELEAWGITQPPVRHVSAAAVQLGLQKLASSVMGSFSTSLEVGLDALDEEGDPILSLGGQGDFEIVCSDGMRLGCDRAILERRWPWFAARMREYQRKVKVLTKTGGSIGGASLSSKKGSRPSTGEQLTALLEEDERGSGQHAAGMGMRADPRITPRQLHLSEPSPVVLALLVFLYTRCICTKLQRHPAIVASLLIVCKVYEMKDLEMWAKHAAHVVMSRELAPPTTGTGPATLQRGSGSPAGGIVPEGTLPPLERHRFAVAIYEAATMSGFEALQIRALRTVMSIAKWVQRSSVSSAKSSGTVNSSGAADSTSNAPTLVANATTPTTPIAATSWGPPPIPQAATQGGSASTDADAVSRRAPSITSPSMLSRQNSMSRSQASIASAGTGAAEASARRVVRPQPSLDSTTSDNASSTAVPGSTLSRASTQSGPSGATTMNTSALQQQRRPSAPITSLPAASNGARNTSAPSNANAPAPLSSSTGAQPGRKRFSIFGRSNDHSSKASVVPMTTTTAAALEQHDEERGSNGRPSTEQTPTSPFARLQRTNTDGSAGGESGRSVGAGQSGGLTPASNNGGSSTARSSSSTSLSRDARPSEAGSLTPSSTATATSTSRKMSGTLSRFKSVATGRTSGEDPVAGATVVGGAAKLPASPGTPTSPYTTSSGGGGGGGKSSNASSGTGRLGAGQLNQKDIKALQGIFA